ncbi:uncharacterized protein MISP3 [Hemicordylus capensis]|uniref:uncharacterized protein MISP3 n=1 Tax=Hemicordylus capensis TaxID=884348 RepID=UPI002302C8D1|nr:uncharacterized protein MISP3 [Hemicordylus capensis]
MTTETLPLPPPTAGEYHRGTLLEGQESPVADVFRGMVESRDVAKNVPITNAPDDSVVPPLEGAISSLANKNVLEESSPPVHNDNDPVEKSSSAPCMPSEALKMADVSSQPDQGHVSGHFIHQNKMPDPPSEQLKTDDTPSLLVQGEGGSHLTCHGEIPDAFSEQQGPAGSWEPLVQGEEGRLPHGHDKDPAASTDTLKPSETLDALTKLDEESKGSPLVNHRDTSGVPPERQESTNTTHPLGTKEESSLVNGHSQPPGAASQSPEQPAEPDRSPKQATSREENSQADCAMITPEAPGTLLLGANSPRQPPGGDGFASLDPLLSSAPSAESQGARHTARTVNQEVELGCHQTAERVEETRELGGLGPQSLAAERDLGHLNGQFSREDSQADGKQVARGASCTSAAPSPASAAPPSDVDGTFCQQRAAGPGCETPPQAAPVRSPVATGDSSCGPAHQGPAPVCDRQDREGLAVHESSEAGDRNTPQGEVGAKAVLESEKGEGAAGDADAGPEEATGGEPEAGAKDPAAAQVRARDWESPELDVLTSTRDLADPQDPAGAMVLASAEDPLGARDRADSGDLASASSPVAAAGAPTEQTGSSLTPTDDLLTGVVDPSAGAGDLVSVADAVRSPPASDEPSTAGGSGCPTNWVGNTEDNLEAPHSTNETPIEKEIRLHLEREELLRRERGLASPRVTQEYVEVRIRPILNQSVPPSPLPKEKERQWAGVQMQREIQRECRREEDLVQLGKVRGAYDRGTPQEMQEKKMLFEQHSSLESSASRKAVQSSTEGMRGPSFAEANSATNVVILDSGALLRSQRPPLERTPVANPFFCLRAKSPQSLLEQEVQEAQQREQELQRQRYNLYGSALPCRSAEASDQEEESPTQPERPLCKKLDFTWPPPSPAESSQVNGLHQPERSPRTLRRQKSALIERWESGTIGNQESQD